MLSESFHALSLKEVSAIRATAVEGYFDLLLTLAQYPFPAQMLHHDFGLWLPGYLRANPLYIPE